MPKYWSFSLNNCFSTQNKLGFQINDLQHFYRFFFHWSAIVMASNETLYRPLFFDLFFSFHEQDFEMND